MNRVEKHGDEYVLICGDESFKCTRVYEKKKDIWHVKLPKDNPSGRTYITESTFDDTDVYEFDTKTERRTGISGGGWRAKLTEAEKLELENLEKRINAIKTEASKREAPKKEKPNLDTEEGIEAEIARLEARRAKMAAAKAAEPAPEKPKSNKKK